MEQKVIIAKDSKEVNEHLKDGWKVVSVTAQHIEVSAPTNGTSSYISNTYHGNLCFVIERPKK